MVNSDLKSGAIGLGDLVRAIKRLQPLADEDLHRVAKSLGFVFHSSSTGEEYGTQAIRGAFNRQRFGKQPLPTAENQPSISPNPSMPPVPEIPPGLPETILDTEIEILNSFDSNEVSIPPNIDKHSSLQNETLLPLQRHSLFSKNTTRGVLVPAVAQPVFGEDLDIVKIVDTLVRCQPLQCLPTKSRYTTRNGCHLLLDFSDQLTPWWPDMQDLMHQLQSILGKEASPVYEFEGDPANAMCWTAQEEKAWKPIKGIPVVVATDLGLVSVRTESYRPGTDIWRQFARHCANHQVPLIALVPAEPHHWPKDLNRLIKLIHWNPATDAASVHRLLVDIR